MKFIRGKALVDAGPKWEDLKTELAFYGYEGDFCMAEARAKLKPKPGKVALHFGNAIFYKKSI